MGSLEEEAGGSQDHSRHLFLVSFPHPISLFFHWAFSKGAGYFVLYPSILRKFDAPIPGVGGEGRLQDTCSWLQSWNPGINRPILPLRPTHPASSRESLSFITQTKQLRSVLAFGTRGGWVGGCARQLLTAGIFFQKEENLCLESSLGCRMEGVGGHT